MASLSKTLAQHTTEARRKRPLGEAPPVAAVRSAIDLASDTPDRAAIEAGMQALLASAQPQSSAEALWILRQHYPQVSLTHRVAAISAVLRF